MDALSSRVAAGTFTSAPPSTGDTMTNVIEVNNLTKRFGKLAAVDDVSFSVRQGEIFGLLGENGAGKTTTIEILEGSSGPTTERRWSWGSIPASPIVAGTTGSGSCSRNRTSIRSTRSTRR